MRKKKTSPHFFKIPFIGPSSTSTQRRVRKLVNNFCTSRDIKFQFLPIYVRVLVACKFTYTGCSACYIGETNRHLSTRVRDDLSTDTNSYAYKHPASSDNNVSRNAFLSWILPPPLSSWRPKTLLFQIFATDVTTATIDIKYGMCLFNKDIC